MPIKEDDYTITSPTEVKTAKYEKLLQRIQHIHNSGIPISCNSLRAQVSNCISQVKCYVTILK
jgi:hypothetical protein